MQDQKAYFYDRVQRIETTHRRALARRQAKPSHRKGPGQAMYEEHLAKAMRVSGTRRRTTLMSLMLALMLGLMAVLLSQYANFHYLSAHLPQPVLDQGRVVDIALAATAALLLVVVFRKTSFAHLLATTAGVVVMLAAMHNLVWVAPDTFAQLFSEDWVAGILSATEPNTFVLGPLAFAV